MSQSKRMVNSHIEEYLDYYCKLSHAPGFAVLLKGQWGSGKTWFINKYCKNFKGKQQRFLYVSLYGMTSFSEIEDAFFQQLHPILSSKGMAITSKIFKGLLKGTLKIDLNNDNRDDGAINVGIPDINLPEYLKNTDKCILVFDDLERCNIDLSNILGYINYFVEHQELKVILIANEDELLKNSSYKAIKEKLIGKTFGVSLDFESALEDFITMVKQQDVRAFLSNNTELVQDLYKEAEYENLRSLKQIILDFARIFDDLPKKAKREPELLKDLLKLLTVFSIEIKRGDMLAKDISQLREAYLSAYSTQISLRQSASTNIKGNSEELTPIQTIFSRYTFLNPYDIFPSELWWQMFFDRGIINAKELEQSILNSKYFQDENTPNWVRLWHLYNLSDNDFDNIIHTVESGWNNREYVEIGVIKHVFGLFLTLSSIGLYHKSKEELLKDSKLYIDQLKCSDKFAPASLSTVGDISDSYVGLGFQGKDFEEFRELSSYLDTVQELVRREERMPGNGQDLLVTMQSDVRNFYRMLYRDNGDTFVHEYQYRPVLKYIQESAFVEQLLSIDPKDQKEVFRVLKKRYEFGGTNLIEELEWLKSVRCLLLLEVSHRQGKLSGYFLKSYIEHYLNEVITKLEAKTKEVKT